MWSMLHCSHTSVSMLVADDVAPIWHEGICNNSNDIDRSAHVSHAMPSHVTSHIMPFNVMSCTKELPRWVGGSNNNIGAILTQKHYLSQHLNFVDWITGNKSQRNLNQNGAIFVQENEIENTICRMARNLIWLRCVNIVTFTFYLWVTFHCTSPPGGRLNKKDGLTRYGNSHVKDKTS